MTIVKKHPSRPSVASRKRTANHHRRGHSYGKAYWPYLPIAAIVTLGVVLNSWIITTQHKVLSYATNMSTQELLDDTNAQRSANGLGALRMNSQLAQAAQNKAVDMATKDYWAHDSPTGATPWTFISATGYSYATAGENLAYGFTTAPDAITGWMNSPGHRANILNGGFAEVGFGVYNTENYQNNGNQTIVVAMYAAPYTSATTVAPTTESSPTTPAPAPEPVSVAQPNAVETTGSSNGQAAGGIENQTTQTANPETAQPKTSETAPKTKQDTVIPASSTTRGQASKADTSTSKSVARIEIVNAANVAWTQFAISMLVSVSILIFLLRHSLAWHKVLVHGKDFVIKHPILDIGFVTIATLGTLLLQTAGYIR